MRTSHDQPPRRSIPIALLLMAVLAGCRFSPPEPKGSARILYATEIAGEEESSLAVHYLVENTGEEALGRSVLSLHFRTDCREYHVSTVDNLGLPSGDFAYGSARFIYYEPEERADLASLELVHAFFE